MTTCYIGVGSNVNRQKHIEAAIRELAQIGDNIRLSTIYECEAVGFESAPFYNLVVEMQTSSTLTEFSRQLRNIEFKWGRAENAEKFQPRTVDLDIILFGDEVSVSSPQLPRNDIYKYGFVIEPLNELCANLIVPGDGRTVGEIWQSTHYQEQLSAVSAWFDYRQLTSIQ